MKNSKNIWKIVTALSLIGIILATYLLYNYYKPIDKNICYVNSQFNCDVVTKGSLATFLGIPVSLVGLIGYSLILFSSLTKRKKLALAMTSLGMFFCLRITILEIFFVKIICPVCLACQMVMFLVFLLALQLNYKLIKF